MPPNIDNISFLYPSRPNFDGVWHIPPLTPFDHRICAMLSAVSQALLKDAEAKAYPDVISFAFWCRKASIDAMKRQSDCDARLGRGVVFHITPSNVPGNFAYSLVAGLLAGNANLVRVPTKQFPQVDIITKAFAQVLAAEHAGVLSTYIVLMRYERDENINAYFSSLCDVRIIWGGDSAINEIRRAPLNPRAFEVVFADRYSICVIDAGKYLAVRNHANIARDFYNDTYLFDQNACTAPHLVIWIGDGERIAAAKHQFWNELHQIVLRQYSFQSVQALDKLTAFYKAAVDVGGTFVRMPDNLILRVALDGLAAGIEDYRCPGGYFGEYSVQSLDEIAPIVNRKYQTLAYYGVDVEDLRQFVIGNHLCGIDRIVPIGKTLDFSLDWDGYDLICTLSRKIEIRGH